MNHLFVLIAMLTFSTATEAARKGKPNGIQICDLKGKALPALFEDAGFKGDPLREFTHILHGNTQFNSTQFIPASQVSNYRFRRTPNADLIEMDFHPATNAVPAENGLAPRNSSASLAVVHATPWSNDIPTFVDQYLKHKNHGDLFNQTMRGSLINNARNDPKFLAMMKSEVGAGSSEVVATGRGSGVRLSNVGTDRFFWFTPKNSNEVVPARVLDIHLHDYNPRDPNSKIRYTVLVEYVNGSDEAAAALYGPTQRLRTVAEIPLSELNTIQRDASFSFSAEAARLRFLDDLTTKEIETVRRAEELRMRLFGYASFGRKASFENPNTLTTPLSMMNNMTWGVVQKTVEDVFGDFSSLLQTKNPELYSRNIIDGFTRLDPQYVLEKYSSRKIEYSWVITEDGRLKICPKMAVRNNLKPQLLRMAAGRRIYAGGDFAINSDGSLRVQTRSNMYHEADGQFGNVGAFSGDNPNLTQFVNETFTRQARAKVQGFHAEDADMFTRAPPGDDASGAGAKRKSKSNDANSGGSFYGRAGSDDFWQTGSSGRFENSWDMEKGAPLSLQEWLDAGGASGARSDPKLQLRWAHYVMGTHSDMRFDELKRAYRQLSMKYHPDRNPGKDTGEVQGRVSEAYDFFNKHMRDARGD